MTTNICVDVQHATSAVSGSAEWITEAPLGGGVVAPLPNYGTLTSTDVARSVSGPLNSAGTGFTDYFLR
ncbi:hypothetical protein GXW82_12035 [Streptacidiphilus sp. 4-A2]|nr:hypothetical protein [Streptacidiphilus sp. 4-A2]